MLNWNCSISITFQKKTKRSTQRVWVIITCNVELNISFKGKPLRMKCGGKASLQQIFWKGEKMNNNNEGIKALWTLYFYTLTLKKFEQNFTPIFEIWINPLLEILYWKVCEIENYRVSSLSDKKQRHLQNSKTPLSGRLNLEFKKININDKKYINTKNKKLDKIVVISTASGTIWDFLRCHLYLYVNKLYHKRTLNKRFQSYKQCNFKWIILCLTWRWSTL